MQEIKYGIWIFGIASWIFGLADRTLASFADGYLSATELAQLFTALTFAFSWVILKPNNND